MIADEVTPIDATLDADNLSVGHRFKRDRENLNLTPKDVASRLHLKPKVIHMLESDDLDLNLPPIFIRGYYRSYGKLMNYSEQIVEQMIDSLKLPALAPPQEMLATYPKKNKYLTLMVPAILFALLALGFYVGSKFFIDKKDEIISAMHAKLLFQPNAAVVKSAEGFIGSTAGAVDKLVALPLTPEPFAGAIAVAHATLAPSHTKHHRVKHQKKMLQLSTDALPAYLQN